MKNFTLFLVLLLPFFGFSQVNLVRWNGANIQPNPLLLVNNGTIAANAITGPSSTGFTTDNYSQPFPGFRGTNYPNSTTAPDYTKYMEVSIVANAGNKIDLSQFIFTCTANVDGPRKIEVRYSTDSSIGTQLITNTAISTANSTFSIPLTGITVQSGTTVYLRVYPYANNNIYSAGTFHMRHGTTYNGASDDGTGPRITGTVTAACTPPVNDNSFGTNSWNGYVYSYTTTPDFTTATYIGTLKEDAIFDRNVGSGQVDGKATTRNIPCVTPPSDRFMIRYKMKLTVPETGNYNFTMGADDGYRLSISESSTTTAEVINGWADQSFNLKAIQKQLTAGTVYYLTFDYYDKTGDARSMFSYGLTKGDRSYPFGINSWNVYAFTTPDITLPATSNASSYAGVSVDGNLNINTNTFWGNQASPSASTNTTYQGAPVPTDNFTISYRRTGFPCGRYQIKMDSWDDVAQVFVNGTSVWSNGSAGSNATITSSEADGFFSLGKGSSVEVRLRENGGDAFVKVSFVNVPVVYTTNAAVVGKPIQINTNTTITSKLDVCSCLVKANTTLTINSIMNVDENIVVEDGGKIIVNNNGSLVQISDVATYTGSNSSFQIKRTTTPVSRYDYTYWSSPLKTESDFLVGRDQANASRKGLSKTTFYDKYYKFDGQTQAWSVIPYGTEVMVPGKGYIVRAPQEFTVTATANFTGVFEGIPNNGVITLPVVNGTTGKANLIGNPYPSAIDATKFAAENASLMDGTFYFWTHNIALSSTPTNGVLQYNPASYISLNKTGSTGTGINGVKASNNIAAGQGFFINTTSAGTIKFNNAMRVINDNSNTTFFRTANQTQSSNGASETADETVIENNRVWLNITNAAGAYNETLIGYVTGATNDIEGAYDGVTYASGTAIYTVVSDQKLVIQGRALPFVNTDIVPLGFAVATAGEYSIGVESFDGLFQNQNVYLLDKSDNTYHNIKEARYTFTATAGTFNSRFEIHYVNDSTLGVDTPVVSQNDIVVYKSGNQIAVRANNLTIDNVQVYDLTGKLIISGKNVNSSEYTTSGLNVATQVLIVKVTLDDNQTVSKKVIMN